MVGATTFGFTGVSQSVRSICCVTAATLPSSSVTVRVTCQNGTMSPATPTVFLHTLMIAGAPPPPPERRQGGREGGAVRRPSDPPPEPVAADAGVALAPHADTRAELTQWV